MTGVILCIRAGAVPSVSTGISFLRAIRIGCSIRAIKRLGLRPLLNNTHGFTGSR